MCSQEANKPPDSWFELKVNTHVYVTGLPDDVTFDEVTLPALLLLICKSFMSGTFFSFCLLTPSYLFVSFYICFSLLND